MNTMSSIDQSSYFPIDGNASEWNGRQIGYLIGRAYQTIERQVSTNSEFYKSIRYEEVKHKLIKNIGNGKKFVPQVIQFKVRTLIMSKEDWITYLLTNKNKFQLDLTRQLRAGWNYEELRLEDKRVIYEEKE